MLNQTYPDIKDEWKRICLPQLENILNKRYNQKVCHLQKWTQLIIKNSFAKAPFQIQISLTIDDTTEEFTKEKDLMLFKHSKIFLIFNF